MNNTKEIVAYTIKNELCLSEAKDIIIQYLKDNDIWDGKRNMTESGSSFAINSAFYDLFIREGKLNELYNPKYKDNVINKESFTREEMSIAIIKAWYKGAEQSHNNKTMVFDTDVDEIIEHVKNNR